MITATAPPLRLGRRVVLVADDEEAIQAIVTRAIARLGLAGMLEKPFTLAVLRAMILQALGDDLMLEQNGA